MVTLLLGNPLLPVVSAVTALPDNDGFTHTALAGNVACANSHHEL
jgi:hypothetical protein